MAARRAWWVVVLAGLLVMTGCMEPLEEAADRHLAGAASTVATLAAGTSAARVPPRVGPASVPVPTGTLRLAIRWPRQDAARQTQLIPTSTEVLVIRIKKDGALVAPIDTAQREAPDEAVVAKAFTLPEQNNLTVEIDAFRGPDVPADLSSSAGRIAKALKGSVTIVRGTDTRERITLEALYVPGAGTPDANAGAPGQDVVFAGSNLGLGSPLASLSVSFNGLVSPRVELLDDTRVRARIPAGATSGPVHVVNDGVPSTPENDPFFWVVDDFALGVTTPDIAGVIVPPGRVYYGNILTYNASYAWQLDGVATADPAPRVTWTLVHVPGVALQSALAPAPGARSADLQAPGGYASASVLAELSPLLSGAAPAEAVGVDDVLVSAGSLALNALPAAGSADGSFAGRASASVTATVVGTLPFDQGVAWLTSDAAMAAVASSDLRTGVVTAGRDAPAGGATVTAISRTDRAMRGAAAARQVAVTISVTANGNLNAGVR